MMLFQKLFELAKQGPIVMSITADGASATMTVNVTAKIGKDAADPALHKQLCLTGKPEEFDRDFISLLGGYTEARRSLIEQADATSEVLAAAKAAQVRKAATASTKASSKGVPPAGSATPPTHEPSQGGGVSEAQGAATGERDEDPAETSLFD